MALITCPECGAQVSSAAASCIKCGCPLTKTKICGECKATIAENASVCPHCGHPQNLVRVRLVDDKKTRKWLEGTPFKWQIYTGGAFNKILLAESEGFGSVEFEIEEPIKASFRYSLCLSLWLSPTRGYSCTIQPGKNYKIYAVLRGPGFTNWAFEEDA